MNDPSLPPAAFRLKYPLTVPAEGPSAEPAPLAIEPDEAAGTARVRLGDLDMHLHCSIVGTCLTDAELRKVISRFVEIEGFSELDVHHEAVRLAGKEPQAARALHKALDRRFEPVLRRFAKAGGEQEVRALWQECLRRGEVPGAYWAVLSHRHASDSLRQEAFGEVHMLSHLMGASTRADLRQRAFLQAENEQLRAQHAQLQDRYQRLIETHDQADQEHQRTLARLRAAEADIAQLRSRPATVPQADLAGSASEQVALHTQRREQAEQRALRVAEENRLLQDEANELRLRLSEVVGELHAADMQLQRWLADDTSDEAAENGPDASHASPHVHGKRLLYVGGRPSSAQAIEQWVERNGGQLRRHDGGLEDRKGQLTASIAWADRVLFPVDCIGHDAAGAIKRHCTRLGIPFNALRTASLASFVAVLHSETDFPRSAAASHLCLRHA